MSNKIKVLLMAMVVSATGVCSPMGVYANSNAGAGAEMSAIIADKDNYKDLSWNKGYTCGDNVNVRLYPSTNSEVITTYDINKKVLYKECTNNTDWYMINLENNIGYIYKDYISDTKITVNPNDVDMLAHLIYAECECLGEYGMRLCANVVINRVASSDYPNDIYSVIHQRGQYAVTNNGRLNLTPSQLAYDVAYDVLLNGTTTPSNLLYQSQFPQGSYTYEVIDGEYFCCK